MRQAKGGNEDAAQQGRSDYSGKAHSGKRKEARDGDKLEKVAILRVTRA